MAWNIGLLCIQAPETSTEDILDVFRKSKEGLCFEDVTSASMEHALGVGYSHSWIIIIDTLGRFLEDSTFVQELSRKYKIKVFWISESLIYRDYQYSFLKKGGVKREYLGVEDGLKYLKSKGIDPWDDWGESLVFQMIEKELFDTQRETFGTTLWEISYDKYELD